MEKKWLKCKSEGETLELLTDRVQNDPDEQIREFAQQQLAKLEKQK